MRKFGRKSDQNSPMTSSDFKDGFGTRLLNKLSMGFNAAFYKVTLRKL
jgi:hypothetical protein